MYSWLPASAAETWLVEAVLQDAVASRGVPRVACHERVEGALHVEHHREERPAARRRERFQVDRPRAARELALAEARREPARRVDRAHQHTTSVARGAQRQRRSRGGLADAAGAAGDEYAPLGERRIEPRGGGAAGRHQAASSVSASVRSSATPRVSRNRKGSDTSGVSSERRSRSR